MMTSELSTGKTIFILAVVVGCFAILWPKVFYPMLTASVKSSTQPAPHWRDPLNAHHLTQLCFLLEEQRDPLSGFHRWTEADCFAQLKSFCRVDMTERILEGFRLEKDKSNLTECLRQRFDLTPQKVSAAAPPPTRTRPYQPHTVIHPHVRPERPAHLHPDVLHPALREKGRTLPQRTIEKEARPGPMPGIRPPMGGGGHMVPPQSKGSGAMGIIMPLYTVGIVIFFIYTIMKVLFKKNCDEDKTPKLKDFHMDPEYRKYVFAEEYLDSSNASHRDLLRRQEREASRQRRRQEVTPPDTKIEDEQMDQLRRRLEETERAMERLMSQMGSVTDKLTAAKITEVLSQAQAQAKMLKDLGEGASDDDFTTSEAYTNTYSEDYSLPIAIQRHLLELQVKDQYQKGTSAGTFVPPPPTPQKEVASLAEEEAPKEVAKADECSLYPSTNDVHFATIPSIDVKSIENESERKTVIAKSEENVAEVAFKLGKEMKATVDPVPSEKRIDENIMQVINKDLNRQLLEAKLKGEFSGLSDIAQRDDNISAGDRSSNPSETGADISELKSFADEYVYLPTNIDDGIPIIQEQIVPEAIYQVPELAMPKDIKMDEPVAHPENKGSETVVKLTNLTHDNDQQAVLSLSNLPKSIEHGTQTDSEKKLSVLNFGTTYQINKQEQEKGMGIHEVEDKVKEIILDATLPMDTQLLVREAHVGSRPVENIEIDATEIENNPCVVTSQVSLAFVGLEQNESSEIMTIILPEKRGLTLNNKGSIQMEIRNESLTRHDKLMIDDTTETQIKIKDDLLKMFAEAATFQAQCQNEVKKTADYKESLEEVSSIPLNEFMEKDYSTDQDKYLRKSIGIDGDVPITIKSDIDYKKEKEFNVSEELLENLFLKSLDQVTLTTTHSVEPQDQMKLTNSDIVEPHYQLELTTSCSKEPQDQIKIITSHTAEPHEQIKSTASHIIEPHDLITLSTSHTIEPCNPIKLTTSHPVESLDQMKLITLNTVEPQKLVDESFPQKEMFEYNDAVKLTAPDKFTLQNQTQPMDELIKENVKNATVNFSRGFLEKDELYTSAQLLVEVKPEISGEFFKVEPSALQSDDSNVDNKNNQILLYETEDIAKESEIISDSFAILQQIQIAEDNLDQTIEEDFEKLKEIIADVTASKGQLYLERFEDQQNIDINIKAELNNLIKSEKTDEQVSSASQIQLAEKNNKETEEKNLIKLAESEYFVCSHDLKTLTHSTVDSQISSIEKSLEPVTSQYQSTVETNHSISEIPQAITMQSSYVEKNTLKKLENVNEIFTEEIPQQSSYSVDIIDLWPELCNGKEKSVNNKTPVEVICRLPGPTPPSPTPSSPTLEDIEKKQIYTEVLIETSPLIVEEDTTVSTINGINCLQILKNCPELNLIAEILVQRTTSEALEVISKMDPIEIKNLRDETSHIMDACNLLSTPSNLSNLVPEPHIEINAKPVVQPGKLGDRSWVENIAFIETCSLTKEDENLVSKHSTRKDSQSLSQERRFAVVSAEHANGLPKVEPSNETMEILVVEPLAISNQTLHSSMKKQDEGSLTAEEAVLLASKGVRNLLNQSSSSPAQTADDDDDEEIETKEEGRSLTSFSDCQNEKQNSNPVAAEEGLFEDGLRNEEFEVSLNAGRETENFDENVLYDNADEEQREQKIMASKCPSGSLIMGSSVEELTQCIEEDPLLASTGD